MTRPGAQDTRQLHAPYRPMLPMVPPSSPRECAEVARNDLQSLRDTSENCELSIVRTFLHFCTPFRAGSNDLQNLQAPELALILLSQLSLVNLCKRFIIESQQVIHLAVVEPTGVGLSCLRVLKKVVGNRSGRGGLTTTPRHPPWPVKPRHTTTTPPPPPHTAPSPPTHQSPPHHHHYPPPSKQRGANLPRERFLKGVTRARIVIGAKRIKSVRCIQFSNYGAATWICCDFGSFMSYFGV